MLCLQASKADEVRQPTSPKSPKPAPSPPAGRSKAGHGGSSRQGGPARAGRLLRPASAPGAARPLGKQPVVVERVDAVFKGPQPHRYKRVEKAGNPGPTVAPGGVGKQVVSNKRSAPAYGFGVGDRFKRNPAQVDAPFFLRTVPPSSAPKFSFGSAPRDQFNKLYMDKSTERYMVARVSAKVPYRGENAATLGKMSFTRPNSPRTKFSKSPRFPFSHRQKVTAGVDFRSPPPEGRTAPRVKFAHTPRFKYQDNRLSANATVLDDKQSTSMGKMVLSKARSSPRWSFGSGPRYTPKAAGVDAAFLDQHMNTLTHPAPTKVTQPRFSFGTSTRKTWSRVGILPQHTTTTGALPGKAY